MVSVYFRKKKDKIGKQKSFMKKKSLNKPPASLFKEKIWRPCLKQSQRERQTDGELNTFTTCNPYAPLWSLRQTWKREAMGQDQALTHGFECLDTGSVSSIHLKSNFSNSRSISSRIQRLHTKTKNQSNFNNIICLMQVCVPYIYPWHPRIPQRTNLSPKDSFLNRKKNKTIKLSCQFGWCSINTGRAEKER